MYEFQFNFFFLLKRKEFYKDNDGNNYDYRIFNNFVIEKINYLVYF